MNIILLLNVVINVYVPTILMLIWSGMAISERVLWQESDERLSPKPRGRGEADEETSPEERGPGERRPHPLHPALKPAVPSKPNVKTKLNKVSIYFWLCNIRRLVSPSRPNCVRLERPL